MKAERPVYEVLWPRGKMAVEGIPYAQRLDTLKDRTICELWDWRYRGDEVFPALEEELARRCPGIKFVNYKVFGSTHGADEAKVIASLPAKLKENKCDAVISAIGC